MQQRSFFTLVALATSLALACGGDAKAPVDPTTRVGSVVLVGPDSVIDDSLGVYTLVIRDRDGQPMPVPSGIAWTFDNPENQAQLHELAPGQLELKAWNPGPVVRISATVYGVEVSVVVRLVPHPPIIIVPPLPLGRVSYYPQSYLAPNDTTRFGVRLGETIRIAYSARGLDDKPIDYLAYAPWLRTVRWESSDTSVASVAGADEFAVTLVGKKMGEVTIRPVLQAAPSPLTLRVTEPLPPVGALPDVVAGGHRWRTVNGGLDHSCGLTTDGDVYCWGANAYGQLGKPASADTAFAPALVPLGVKATSVSATSVYTCAVGTDDAAYCWGSSLPFPAGRETLPASETPARPAEVFAGSDGHACVRTTDGRVACWGYANAGQLGPSGAVQSCPTGPGVIDCRAHPQFMETEHRFTTLALGDGFSCGLVATGEAYCWGATALGGPVPKGETCMAPGGAYNTPAYPYDCRRTPLLVPGGHQFRSLSGYSGTVCGVSVEGEVWCWGGVSAPTLVPALTGVRAVSVGPRHGCAVLSDGGVRCWGDNNSLALGASGLAGASSVVTPVAPAGEAETLGAGIGHTCEVRRDGAAVCWGAQRAGQLGRGGFVR